VNMCMCRRVVIVALSLQAVALARVEVNVTHAGFATLRGGDAVRSGQWAPIIVDLDLLDQALFDGYVRVAQPDLDGDECYDSVDVHLRAETGGTQRVFLYVPANTRGDREAFDVEVVSADGEAVEVVSQGTLTFRVRPAQRPERIADDDILILSLSTGVIGRVGDLVGPEQRQSYARDVHVAHMSPGDLPEHWIGLEAVDYVVWDDARPEDMTSRQIGALIEWVCQGGTILIAASRSAGSLELTEQLKEVLPVRMGEITAVSNLPDVRRDLVEPPKVDDRTLDDTEEWLSVGFGRNIPVARCKCLPGAQIIAEEKSIEVDVVTRRREGRGHVIFSAVTLKDLFSASGNAVGFFCNVLHLERVRGPDEDRPDPVSLFQNVVSAVSFSTKAGTYLVVAGLSSVAYVVLATFGTWGFLRTRRWEHRSWTVFATAALVVSAVAMTVVNSLQGFGESLHQVSIVDADAGDTYGRGTVYFGLKTSSDKEVDVWLPSDPLAATEPGATRCFLRPMPTPRRGEGAGTSFADPQEYRIIPASAVIDNVRIRATLKQFEGRWEGPLNGRLTGQVTVRNHRVTDDSFVVNELGVVLDPCYLLFSELDAFKVEGVRDTAIRVHEIGPIPSDGLKIRLAPRCYRPVGRETIADIVARSTLEKYHEQWSNKFGGLLSGIGFGGVSDSPVAVALGEERTALLLASTISDFDPASLPRSVDRYRPQTLSRDQLRQFDLREHLQRDSAVLIGFASHPGPIRLFGREGDRDFTAINPDPDKSWIMYRIRIPATSLKGGSNDPVDEELTVESLLEGR